MILHTGYYYLNVILCQDPVGLLADLLFSLLIKAKIQNIIGSLLRRANADKPSTGESHEPSFFMTVRRDIA
jgi:hypothetical protein